jgi:hypothetical protein
MKTKLLSTVLLTSISLVTAHAGSAGDGLVAHEWGTFTSVQGADGIQFEWNPLSVSELPRFVYNRMNPAGTADAEQALALLSKGRLQARQRMETPVIYLYSERARTVDVHVDFPGGTITEWYPQSKPAAAATANPLLDLGLPADPRPDSPPPHRIDWENVQILPRLANATLAGQLPQDPSGSHYYAARQTEADFLQVVAPDKKSKPGKLETEKFLFYRGVAQFQAPLVVTQSGENGEKLELKNNGAEELRHLFVYSVADGRAKVSFVPELAPGASRSVALSRAPAQALSETRARLAAELVESLASEGLFRPEAEAMVKTWEDSWLTEPGLRVLYTLPRAWTDRTLPLRIEPAPQEIARVMVGRAELITPAMEWALMRQIVRYHENDTKTRPSIVNATRQLGLGRFLEPTARRLQGKLGYREFELTSAELLQAAAQPVKSKGLAAR